MKKAPDVMGLQLSHAEKILSEAGIEYRLHETAPPPGRRELHPEETRVVRQSSKDGVEILLICRI